MTNAEFKKWKKTVSHEFTLVNDTLAQEMLEYNIHNREPKFKKILAMVTAMIDGRFLYTGDTIKFDWNGNVIDGQNRLMSICKSGIPQPLSIIRGLDPESAKFMDIGTKRQLKDWLQFMQVVNSSIISPALRALDAYYVDDAPKRIGESLNKYEIPIDRSLELFSKIRENIEEAAGWAKANKKSNPLSPSQTATIYHVLSEIDSELSMDFLNELCCGVDLKHGSPTKILRNYLEEMKSDAKCGKRASIRASQVFKLTITAWNYWIQDYDMPKAVFELNADFPIPLIP